MPKLDIVQLSKFAGRIELKSGGIAAGSQTAVILLSQTSRTRDCHRNSLCVRRRLHRVLEEAENAPRPPEPLWPAQARTCDASHQNKGAIAFLHMHIEPVQGSRSNGDDLRQQERKESEIRASTCEKADLLPSGAGNCGRAPPFPHPHKLRHRWY